LLTDKPLRELLAAFASPDPTPGGGSASAVASAVGASLLIMVAGLPKTRTGSDDDRAALAGAATSLTGLQQQLTEAVDLDAAAYDQVVAAYKLPKEGDQTARNAAIQRALRSATDVPLGVMRLSAMALKQAEAVAAHGHRAASSDVGVAAALIGAGFHGARLNVEINLGSLSDRAYVEAVRSELERLEKDTAFALSALRAAVTKPAS
jgi:formiminotetrahydrofolate cyclodeaminase